MPPRTLILGGHGKVSLQMVPLLLARSWHVTSVIRDASQGDDIRSAGSHQIGKIEVLVRSLDDIKSTQDAQTVLEKVKPDYVIWSAGAGGKGGAAMTNAIDRDAAKHFISASVQNKAVTKFLMISYLGSRRKRASWWTDEKDWAAGQKFNNEIAPAYYHAKLEADEHLTALAKERGNDFHAIDLRPGTLTDGQATGVVSLGKTRGAGEITRADVADVAVKLLASNAGSGWYDLLEGGEPVDTAIERVIRNHVDSRDGEDEDTTK